MIQGQTTNTRKAPHDASRLELSADPTRKQVVTDVRKDMHPEDRKAFHIASQALREKQVGSA